MQIKYETLSMISIIVSIINFIFTIVVFYKYDRKIKKQEIELIHKFQVLNKKANFEINVRRPLASNKPGYIAIKNVGQSSARNVRIKMYNIEQIEEISDSYTISPNEEISFMYIIYLSSKRNGVVDIFFDDDLENNNHIKKNVELY